MHAVLTRSDLRWMDEQRRRRALSQTSEADERRPGAMAPERAKAEEKPASPAQDHAD